MARAEASECARERACARYGAMSGDEKNASAEEAADAKAGAVKERRISARELLGNERILRIEHNGEVYTLRLTRNDRLILTK
jgi:hemin uptake protein HemP